MGISHYARIPFDTEEKIQGVTVRKTRLNRNVVSTTPDVIISTAESSYSGSNNGVPVNLIRETITTAHYQTSPEFLRYRVLSVQHPDGRKDTHTYEKGNYLPNADPSLSQFVPDENGLAERDTIVHGNVTSPQGVAFKTTKDVSVRDQNGSEVLNETYVYNGTGYERIAWTVLDHDQRGHITMSRNHKGELTTAVWNGEQKTSVTEASGIENTYTYDALNRIKTQTKKGVAAGGGFPAQNDIVTTFSYDAEGRQTSEVVTGGSLSLSTSRVYDRVGRVTRETDQAGLDTTYSYPNGGRTQVATSPGGVTEITDRYLDGRSKSVAGTGVVARYLDYGVNADGTRYTQEFTGSGGLNSPRWSKTTIDCIGRLVSIEKPSFTGTNVIESSFYNSLDQLQKQTMMAGTTKLIADKLFEYDLLGRQSRVGLDIDASGTLVVASMDRISETESVYEKVGTADWFRVSTNRTYLTDNNSTPTSQSQRERLNNFPLIGTDQTTSETRFINEAGQSTITTTATDRTAKKHVTLIDTPDSNINSISIAVNGLSQSSVPTTPQSATTYLYDSLGRMISVTDPRTGTTTRNYSATRGQLTAMNDGADNTLFEYYPVTHINAGRLRTQTNAAGKKIYFSYNSRGEQVQSWGDATYPLENVYDSYGQRIELHTFRGGQNWSSSSWPSSTTGTMDVTKWIYQESTGLLTQKQDPALKGPTYIYDELGRVKTRLWARGITTTYGYDANTGQLRTITYSDSTPAISFTYDRGGRQTNITDAAGSRARTFTVAGELQTEQIIGGILDGVGVTVGHDSFLRRDSLQTSHGPDTLSNQTYGYDASSRLQTITSGSQSATYVYHPNSGLLNTTTFTGGTNIARTYDALGRLENITTTPVADVAQSYTYTYNDLNQRTRVTREDGGYWSYIYNDRGELVSGKKYWSDNSIVWGAQTEHSFDNIGNRKSAKNGGNNLGSLRQSNYTTDALNQYSQRSVPGAVDLTGIANTAATVTVNNQATARKAEYFYKELTVDNSSTPSYPQINVVGARNNFGAGGEDAVTQKGGRAFIPRTPEVFTYDDDGNLTSDGRWNYTWDGENRLVSMEAIASVPPEAKQRLEFAYDFMARRIQKKTYLWNIATSSYQLQSATKFVYDRWNLMAELDVGNAVIRNFVWGQDITGTLQAGGGIGGLLLIKEVVNTYYAAYDGNGNVVTLTSASAGTLSAFYEYDGFGNSLRATGDYANKNPFRFSTKYTDQETGLVYYGFRYYRPEMGRWINRDPLEEEGGLNLYWMLQNDSLNTVDYLGLSDVEKFKVVIKSFIGVVGKNYGSFPGFGPNKNRRNAVLAGFAAIVDANFSEDPRTDLKDRGYRMYSEKNISACCDGNKVASYEAGSLITDAGKEGCIQAPALMVENERTEKIEEATVFRYTVKGTPNIIVEPIFQSIFPRDVRAISHKVSVILYCFRGKPGVEVMLDSESSPFPSHRAFVNGEWRWREDIKQGPLVKLWYL